MKHEIIYERIHIFYCLRLLVMNVSQQRYLIAIVNQNPENECD